MPGSAELGCECREQREDCGGRGHRGHRRGDGEARGGCRGAGTGMRGSLELGENAGNKAKIAEAGALSLAQKAWEKHRHATATNLISIVDDGRRRIQTLHL